MGSSLEMSLNPNCPNLQIRSAPCMPTNHKATYDLGKKESPILSSKVEHIYGTTTSTKQHSQNEQPPCIHFS